MNTMKARLDALKKEWAATKDETTRKEIDEKINALVDEDPEEFSRAFQQSALEAIAKAAKLRSEEVKEKLSPVMKVVNWSYVAETYFGKTKAWFSQKLNGKPAGKSIAFFKREELNILADALRDISRKLEDVANNIHS